MKYKEPKPKPLGDKIVDIGTLLFALWLPLILFSYFSKKGAVLTVDDRYMVAAIWYILVGFHSWWKNGKTFKEKKSWQPEDYDDE